MVSIIIVHYKVPKELLTCISSIYISNPKTKFEIIVVDNDEKQSLKSYLKKAFPKVRYIKSRGNVGFGAGNNIGAAAAKGQYLFFLNPDTTVYANCLDALLKFLTQHKDVGIVAPLLLGKDGKPYQQGTQKLNPLRAIFSLSFIHTLWPKNPIARKYWLSDWNRKHVKEVDVSPGTAMFIRTNLFEKSGGFDTKFFLYFEEFDLCIRIKKHGYKIFIISSAKVKHLWGVSTKKRNDINQIFINSRKYYFRKHYGLLASLFVESILRINKYKVLLSCILLFTTFLSLYKLDESMVFIGDQGWYYLSARDIMIAGNIPLVGIASSHPWLHQGALWTYMLAPILWLFQYNPLAGAYLTSVLHLLTVCLLYFVVTKLFSERTALIAALLYASSPLIIFLVRMPYHTTPIPFFAILFFFFMYKWTQGKVIFFPLIIATLAILYNLEIATFTLSLVFGFVLLFGLWKRKKWVTYLLNLNIIFYSIIAFIVPMLSMLIYDVSNGFPQTVKFLAWVGYKILLVFGYPSLNPEAQTGDIKTVIVFLAESYKKLVYLPGSLVAFAIAIFSFSFLLQKIYLQIKLKSVDIALSLVFLIIFVSISGILATKTASDAYLPMLFPFVIILTALFFDELIKRRPQTQYVVFCIILIIAGANAYTLIQERYFSGTSYKERKEAAQQIVSQADGKRYNLVGKGIGSQFESFTMNYEYFAWWLGNGPSKTNQQLQIIVEETPQGTKVIKRSN